MNYFGQRKYVSMLTEKDLHSRKNYKIKLNLLLLKFGGNKMKIWAGIPYPRGKRQEVGVGNQTFLLYFFFKQIIIFCQHYKRLNRSFLAELFSENFFSKVGILEFHFAAIAMEGVGVVQIEKPPLKPRLEPHRTSFQYYWETGSRRCYCISAEGGERGEWRSWNTVNSNYWFQRF